MSNYFDKEKEICNLANSGKSFVKGFKQELDGFSGKKLFNTLVGLTQNLKGNNIYLEIGVFRGKTLLTNAVSNPHVRCVGIDNFSLFNESKTNKEIVEKKIKELNLKNVELLDMDYEFALDNLNKFLKKDEKVGVFFIDGPHDYRSQLIPLLKIEKYLANKSIIIIDDANYAHVRQATKDFLTINNSFKLLCEAYTETHVANLEEIKKQNVLDGWWNGVNIIVKDEKNYLEKNLPQIDKENRDFHFLTHDFMRSRYIEINHELMSLITRLKNEPLNDRDIIEKIKILIKSHESNFPNRYNHQNTYSNELTNFKLF